MNIIGVIPARGGSKGVKSKNILDLGGKPVIGHTIEAAQKAKTLDKVIVSTDSEEIADVVRQHYDVEIIMRPSELALDDSPIEEALLHVVETLKKEENYETDIVVLMQANVPFRADGLIDEVVEKLVHSDAHASVTCHPVTQAPELMKVVDEQGFLQPLVKDVKAIRRQEFPDRYMLDGSVAAVLAQNLYDTRGIRRAHVFLGEKVLPTIQKDDYFSIEIDNWDDFFLAQYYLDKLQQQTIANTAEIAA